MEVFNKREKHQERNLLLLMEIAPQWKNYTYKGVRVIYKKIKNYLSTSVKWEIGEYRLKEEV